MELSKAKYLMIVTSAMALITFQFIQMPLSNKPRPSPARAEDRKSATAWLTTTVSTSTTTASITSTTSQVSKAQTTVATTQVSNEDWMAKMEAKYHKANERISTYCKKYMKDLQGPLSINDMKKHVVKAYQSRMLYDPKHGLGYCPQAKVGTSTWLSHFLKLSNHSDMNLDEDPAKIHARVPKMFKLTASVKQELDGIADEVDFILALKRFFKKNEILNFSFVRHPFKRVVSAYTDKVLGSALGATWKVFQESNIFFILHQNIKKLKWQHKTYLLLIKSRF